MLYGRLNGCHFIDESPSLHFGGFEINVSPESIREFEAEIFASLSPAYVKTDPKIRAAFDAQMDYITGERGCVGCAA